MLFQRMLLAIIVSTATLLIAAGLAMNVQYIVTGQGQAGGSIDTSNSFTKLALKTEHPGFAILWLGVALEVIALWAMLRISKNSK